MEDAVQTSLKYFSRVYSDIDPAPFLKEIDAHSHFWTKHIGRQKFKVQSETQTIYLRAPTATLILPPKLIRFFKINIDNAHRSCWTIQSKFLFPKVSCFLQEFAKRRNGKLARAMIVRLKPRGQVYEHYDQGEYYKKRDRYHLVLQSPGGSVLNSGGESVTMRVGELWWFDNKKVHSAVNPSDDWRIHVIFDVTPS